MHSETLRNRMSGLGLVAMLVAAAWLLGWTISAVVNLPAPSGQSSNFFMLLIFGAVALAVLIIVLFTNSQLGLELTLLAAVVVLARANMQVALVEGSLFVATAVDVLVLLALLVIAAHYALGRPRGTLSLHELNAPLLAFLVVGFVGTLVALVRDVPLLNIAIEVKGFYFNILIAPIVVYAITTIRQLVRLLVTIACAASFTALTAVQQATQGGGLSSWLGDGVIIQRASGIYNLVNQYAFLVMAALLLAVGLLFYWGRHPYTLLLTPVAGLLAIGLVLSFSRGAYLGLAVGLAVLLLTIGGKRFVALALLSILAIPFLPDTVSQRILTHDNAIDDRLSYWNIATQTVGAYPLLGAGWGAVVVFQEGQEYAMLGQLPWWHNDYLNIASQVGLLGLTAFLAIWWRLQKLVRGTLKPLVVSRLRPLIAALFSAIMAMLTQAATDHFFWRAETAPYFWLVVGLLVAACNIARKETQP